MINKVRRYPGARCKPPIRYGYADARAYERRFDMCLPRPRISHIPQGNRTGASIDRHIVAPLCIMSIHSFPGCSCKLVRQDSKTAPLPPSKMSPLSRAPSLRRTCIFFHYPVQRIAHVRPHIVVPILIHRQCTARVLQEEVQQSTFYAGYRGKRGNNVVCDEVRTSTE